MNVSLAAATITKPPEPARRAAARVEPRLTVQDLCVRFGGVRALDRVSFEVAAGEVCGLIGPNGAGKSTLINCISAAVRPDSGRLYLDAQDLQSLRPHELAWCGIARTFQNLGPFAALSVRQNVLIGAHSVGRCGFAAALLNSRAHRAEEALLAARCDEVLNWLELTPYAHVPVGLLPAGLQRRVELARALASRPKLLLLDEPAAGLTPAEIDALAGQIRTLHQIGQVTVLLVEHNMQLVMSVCKSLVVLDFGQVIARGTPVEIQANADVVRAYLGESQ